MLIKVSCQIKLNESNDNVVVNEFVSKNKIFKK